MTLIDTASLESHKLFKDLGIEPLSKQFDAAHLSDMMAQTTERLGSTWLLACGWES